MCIRIREIVSLTRDAGKQSVAMQHKLLLYWLSMLMAIFGVLLVVLSIAGVFSRSEEKLHQALVVQHHNTVSTLNEQMATLTAHGIAVSEKVSNKLNSLLYTEPISALNNDAKQLKLIEHDLYDVLNTSLCSSPCNGVYMVLDATINTKAEGADTSRAGLYLRFANLNTKTAVEQDVVLYRGIADIARENQLELHNRWKMEFDNSLFEGYTEVMSHTTDKLSNSCFWTQRVQLTDTWESVIRLVVPIEGRGGVLYGICGVELSDLYLRLYYPAWESDFGNMVTVIAPMENNVLQLSQGMSGAIDGTYLESTDNLYMQQAKNFNIYSGHSEKYLGVHTKLDMNMANGSSMYAVTLVPESSYSSVTTKERVGWIIGSLIFLSVMVTVAVLCSGWFVRPIAKSIAAVCSDAAEAAEQTGILEIDDLLSLIRSKTQSTGDDSLPDNIAELFDDFAARAALLTTTERSIVRYYAEGKEVAEVAELAFVSIHTVRRHNANIYHKLGVGARDELMLYIELFRRCGRLDEILESRESLPEK